MMQWKIILFISAWWVFSTLICLTCEGAYYGTDENTNTVLSQFANCKLFTSDDVLGMFVGLFDPQLYEGIGRMVIADYEIFPEDSTWQYARFIIFLPINFATIALLAFSGMQLVRGTG